MTTTDAVAPRRRIIRRPRLTTLLDESPARIKLLVAPAGYGKTTLAQEWLAAPERRGVWYRGGPASADVAALAAGLAVTTSDVVSGAGQRLRERLRATANPEEELEVLVDLLAEDLQAWPASAWVALDEYQFAMESPASERFVELLVDATPIQIVITTRRRPTWATARRIVYGEIQEIDRRALAMEPNEARKVLGGEGQRAGALIGKARGWAAVLGLAAAAETVEIRDDHLPEALYEYFAEELYRGADSGLRLALHTLALVPTVSSDLAEALFGEQASTVADASVRLGAIISRDDGYALHPLFRTFLNQKMARENRAKLHALADDVTHLLIRRREWDLAFDVISASESMPVFPLLVEAALADLLVEGRTQTVLAWLDFANQHHLGDPVLDLAEAEVAFRQGDYVRAEMLAANAARRSLGSLTSRMNARAGQAAVMDSRDAEGMEHFEAAVANAQTQHDRLEALVGISFAALELGRVDDAARALSSLSTLDLDSIDSTLRKAVVQLVYASRVGGVQSALGIGSRVLPLLDDARDPVVVTSFLNTYAHLLGLAAQYPDALSIAGLEISKANQYRLLFVRRHALLIQAVSYSGLRDFAKATEAVGEAEDLAGHARDIHVSMHAAALRARIALCRGEFEDAYAHASREWNRPASAPMNSEYLAYRAVALACLGRAKEAAAAADHAESMHGSSVEALSLVACARAIAALVSERDDAERLVEDAYALVTVTGGLDTLVIAGRAFPRLLGDVAANPTRRDAVANLLARGNDFRLAKSLGIDVRAPIIGPLGGLTRRERDVADLIAHGQTNLEIANALFISESTVKVHVRHILEKLNARTRTEVAARIASDHLRDV